MIKVYTCLVSKTCLKNIRVQHVSNVNIAYIYVLKIDPPHQINGIVICGEHIHCDSACITLHIPSCMTR